VQNKPYYKGQAPFSVSPSIVLWKNPQWQGSVSAMSTVGLTPSELAYMKAERERNSLKFGSDLHWLEQHPALVAAVLAAPIAPEGLEIYFAATSDAVGGIAAYRALQKRRYVEAVLDITAMGIGRLAVPSLSEKAGSEAFQATKATAAMHAAQHAIASHPGVTETPQFLREELTAAIAAVREARTSEEHLRAEEAFAHALARTYAYGAAMLESSESRRHG
jgi:hypothetical protein